MDFRVCCYFIVHITIFHLVAWKIFPSLQENDFAVAMLGLSVAEVDVATRSLNAMLSNGVAWIFGNLVSYLLNIFWVFESGRRNRIIEIGLFYLVSGVSMGVGTGRARVPGRPGNADSAEG